MTTTTGSAAAGRLKRMRETYVKQLPAQLEKIRACYAEFYKSPDEATLKDVHRYIHNLKGSSVSFGLKRFSAIAALAEEMAKEAIVSGDAGQLAKLKPDWNKLMIQLESEMNALNVSEEAGQGGMELSTAAQILQEEALKTVYLCEDEFFQRQILSTQIGCFGFQVVAFGDLEQLQSAVSNSIPDAILMDLVILNRSAGGVELMAAIQACGGAAIPTVFYSSQNNLASRLAAVRAGSSAYFTKPVNPTELCATLRRLTSTDTREPYRIMIVDDDAQLAQTHAEILNGAGMATLILTDPLQVIGPLFQFKPDLILTEMHMASCDGKDLAKAIRQIVASFSIPIICLSGETDLEKQLDALREGGDAFLSKPVAPEQLIAAVANSAERMRTIRSMMITDEMTGLFNHAAIKARLEDAIALAKTGSSEVCFALIDLDRMRGVNSAHGRPVGDQVLITMARLLQQRLPKTNLIGRYGDDEFAVIIPESDITAATAVLDVLRESFSQIVFPVDDKSLQTTCSCGVASLSRYVTPERLCKAAEESLYEAKKGRNRIVAAGSWLKV